MNAIEQRHFFSVLQANDSRVDEKNGTIYQASLIALGQAQGHKDEKGRQVFVDKTTLQQVFDYCNETGPIKLKADHGGGVFTTIGYVDNYSMQADKVCGDLHIYETEEERPKIFEIARKNPNHMGISLEFDGEDDVDGKQCLARCDSVYTIALVSDPAANKSLFEKKIAKINKTDTTTNMAKKKLSDDADPTEPKQTKDDVTADPNDENGAMSKMDDMLKRCEEMSAKMESWAEKFSKFVTDDARSDKDTGTDPKATDPSTEPEVQTNPKDSTYEAPKDGDKEDGQSMDKKMAKIANDAADRAIKNFAARLGTNLPSAGQNGGKSTTEKTFEAMLEQETTRFEGDKDKAMAFLMGKIGKDAATKKAYAAYRPVAKRS